MSFTTAPILHRESMIVANLFAERRDWNVVKEVVAKENLMQAKRTNTSISGRGLQRLRSRRVKRLRTSRKTSIVDAVLAI
jgi:hypothetical protein